MHALVSVASRLVVMNFGQVLAQGDPHEVMANAARARSVYGHPGIMTLLQTHNLSAFYGDFQALFDINVTVEEGETVAIIGANGAGKTTFLRAVAGALRYRTGDGAVRRPADRRIIPRTISCGSGIAMAPGRPPAVSEPFGGGEPPARRP